MSPCHTTNSQPDSWLTTTTSIQHLPLTFVFDLHNCQTTWHPRQRKSPASQPRKLWPRSPLLVARRDQRRPLRATRSISTRYVAQLASRRSVALVPSKVEGGQSCHCCSANSPGFTNIQVSIDLQVTFFLLQVLKQVHPDTGISSKAMSILNSFIADIFEKIAVETASLARYNKKPTVTSREIQTAVRLILPGELAKHAVSEGTKAVTKFTSA